MVDFNPNEPGVEKVEIEGPTGDEILTTVHLASVATKEDGKYIARKVQTAALNRISFFHRFAIENGQITDSDFSPVNPPSGFHLVGEPGHFSFIGHEARFVVGLSASRLKQELEQVSPPGEAASPGVWKFVFRYPCLKNFFHNWLITNDLKAAKASLSPLKRLLREKLA